MDRASTTLRGISAALTTQKLLSKISLSARQNISSQGREFLIVGTTGYAYEFASPLLGSAFRPARSLFCSPGSDDEDIQRFSTAFLLRGIDIETLDREGTRWEAGQTDLSNDTTFWLACINVSMLQSFSCHQMLRILHGEDGG